MPNNLIRVKQLDQNELSGFVGQSIVSTGLLNNYFVSRVDDQTISGTKTFATGVNISGQVGIGINNNDKFGLYVRKSAAGVTVNPDGGSIAVFEGSGNSHITVLASDGQTAGVVLGSPADNFASYLSWNHDNRALKLATAKTSGFIQILTNDENEAVRITRSGDVGIGTISPSEKLQVVGNILANNLVYNTGNQIISGNKTFVNSINVSGTGIFNSLDLNNIDILSLSGVDITITSGAVTLTNPVSAPNLVYNTGDQTISGVKTFSNGLVILTGNLTVGGTGVLLTGKNIFVLQGGTTEAATVAADTNYIGLAGANIGYSNTAVSRRVPILENCVARKASITLLQGTLGASTSNITGSIVNLTQGLTGIISQSMSSTNNNNFISFSNSNLNVPFSAGDNAAAFIHCPSVISNLRTLVNVYFYN